MKKFAVIASMVFLLLGFKRISTKRIEPGEIRTAVTKGLSVLQRSSHIFLENAGGCHSCHGQGLGGVAFSLAKEAGFTIEDSILNEAMSSITDTWKSRVAYLAQNEDPTAIVIGGGYDLWALAATHTQPDKTIELLAKNILQRQRKDGSWVSPNARPPMEYYTFSATALAVKGVQAYLPSSFQSILQSRIVAARTWLTKNIPEVNEEKAFQLLGLAWSGGDTAFIRQQAQKLLRAQRADGGWAQLDSLPTDAYATGQSLYALHQSGQLTATAPSYQKGIAFLLHNQQEDGSWRVKTRSFPSVPFVDSGFPHGNDQFISAAASNWAVMALLLAVE